MEASKGVLNTNNIRSAASKPYESSATSPSVSQRVWFNKQEQSIMYEKRQDLCSIPPHGNLNKMEPWQRRELLIIRKNKARLRVLLLVLLWGNLFFSLFLVSFSCLPVHPPFSVTSCTFWRASTSDSLSLQGDSLLSVRKQKHSKNVTASLPQRFDILKELYFDLRK